MRLVPGHAQHVGSRESQQDSFGFSEFQDDAFSAHGGKVAIVCDGMGGLEHGEIAGATAVKEFLAAYSEKTAQESIPEALVRSVRRANQRVLTIGGDLGSGEGIGTTLVAAVVHEGKLYWASVGDSALYLYRSGALAQLNHPHVFANLLDRAVEQGALSREEADQHPERESLTSYVGASQLDEIDVSREPLEVGPGDTILIASDGLFKTLDEKEIVAALTGAPASWPQTLVEKTLAKKRPYQDNVTVVIIAIENEAPKAARAWWVGPFLAILLVAIAAAALWYFSS